MTPKDIHSLLGHEAVLATKKPSLTVDRAKRTVFGLWRVFVFNAQYNTETCRWFLVINVREAFTLVGIVGSNPPLLLRLDVSHMNKKYYIGGINAYDKP